ADNSNPTAQFNLGDMYINGKLGVPKNRDQGIKYLKLAALNRQPKATEVLKGMKIDIYNTDAGIWLLANKKTHR
ncbi:17350_t:CDS:2, partial [Entrophospora sp. SA101]